MYRYLAAFVLTGALLAPVALRADDERHRYQRYYDSDRRDYHEWNDRENRAYREYLKQQRRNYRDWHKVNRDEQRDYWRWRHNHPEYDRDR